jgi:hypothetical protein
MSSDKLPMVGTCTCARKNRKRLLAEILRQIISSGCKLFIVVTKESRCKPETSLLLSRGSGFSMYSVCEPADIEKGIRLLTGMKLWHKPVFHVLIGTSDLKDYLSAVAVGSEKSLAELEESLNSYLIGYIDPVDDILEFYGNKKIEGILGNISEVELV